VEKGWTDCYFGLLVGGFKHVLFSMIYVTYIYIYGILLPSDELIFFRGVETTNQVRYTSKKIPET